jgi:HSP20 family molecular chaperone IbpA
MRRATLSRQIWNGRKLKISAVNPSEQTQRMRDAVGRRAYQLYQNRGFRPGQELQDWRRAEWEVVKPLSCGFLTQDAKISLNSDASFFQEGEIEICVEPRRLAVCGREDARKKETIPGSDPSLAYSDFVFRVLDLPAEIDPSQVTARFNGRVLEIELPRARLAAAVRVRANAA